MWPRKSLSKHVQNTNDSNSQFFFAQDKATQSMASERRCVSLCFIVFQTGSNSDFCPALVNGMAGELVNFQKEYVGGNSNGEDSKPQGVKSAFLVRI